MLEVSTDYLFGLSDDPFGHLGDGKLKDTEREIINAFRREGWAGIARVMADSLGKSVITPKEE